MQPSRLERVTKQTGWALVLCPCRSKRQKVHLCGGGKAGGRAGVSKKVVTLGRQCIPSWSTSDPKKCWSSKQAGAQPRV